MNLKNFFLGIGDRSGWAGLVQATALQQPAACEVEITSAWNKSNPDAVLRHISRRELISRHDCAVQA